MWVLSVIPCREIVWMVTVGFVQKQQSHRVTESQTNLEMETHLEDYIIWQCMAINYMICLKSKGEKSKSVPHWPIATLRRCWCLDYSIRSFCHCAHLSLRQRFGDEEHWQIPVCRKNETNNISIVKKHCYRSNHNHTQDISLMLQYRF